MDAEKPLSATVDTNVNLCCGLVLGAGIGLIKDGVWGVFNSMCSESLHELPSSTKPHWSAFTPDIYVVMKWCRVGGEITFYNKEPTDTTSAASTSEASALWQLHQWVKQSDAGFLKSSGVYLWFQLNKLARACMCSGAKMGKVHQ